MNDTKTRAVFQRAAALAAIATLKEVTKAYEVNLQHGLFDSGLVYAPYCDALDALELIVLEADKVILES